jgi:hypothetical protein
MICKTQNITWVLLKISKHLSKSGKAKFEPIFKGGKRMKKHWLIKLGAPALALSLVTACGNDEEQNPPPEEDAPIEEEAPLEQEQDGEGTGEIGENGGNGGNGGNGENGNAGDAGTEGNGGIGDTGGDEADIMEDGENDGTCNEGNNGGTDQGNNNEDEQ